jgi:UDP-glucose 4-epimerase
MRSSLVWIVGRGGLLGSQLTAALARAVPGARTWAPPQPAFAWRLPAVLAGQLDAAAAAFVHATRTTFDTWAVLWVAGAGVIGTDETTLQEETHALALLLQLLDRHSAHGETPLPGFLFLASSAGGVYGNCADQPISESSPCRPISAYGRNKLAQEQLVHGWAQAHPLARCLIGRISNLYGPGQDLTKPQGLISHVSRCVIWQRPIHIYVPLDTIRDYLYIDDGAQQVLSCLAAWAAGRPPHPASGGAQVKLFAAERTTTVAQIVGAFRRIHFGRSPRVICTPTALAAQQPRRLQFRSTTEPELGSLYRTPLTIGICNVHRYHLARFRQGKLPAP